ncbi:unnamed protein product [Ambrosiozyma monospora]|uniref:Unnamed protein product n=1 Tax=Ambrosiozyma monospora TaxID=43982 RepID=A0ACB5TZ64_AMBMO|nr:unnamed protein product [Ambrosiozyma monospora]
MIRTIQATFKYSILKRLNSTLAVGAKINNVEELKKLFNKSTWNTNDLLKQASTTESTTQIDKSILTKLLNLTGLTTNITEDHERELISSLNDQLKFINQLHSIEITADAKSSDKPQLTRLMDDLSADDTLTYDELISDIENTKIDQQKGEVEDSWDATSLSNEAEDNYFIVKEGLIKKNKQ